MLNFKSFEDFSMLSDDVLCKLFLINYVYFGFNHSGITPIVLLTWDYVGNWSSTLRSATKNNQFATVNRGDKKT